MPIHPGATRLEGTFALPAGFRDMLRPANILCVLVVASLDFVPGSAFAVEPAAARPSPITADIVLRGGTLIDGTGAAAYQGDVAIKGDRIVAVGSFPIAEGVRIVDVSSLIIAPGFIDLHTHSDEEILKPATRLNLNYLTQGVTTVVTGNCGSGPIDITKYLAAIDAHGAGTNVIHLIPHGSLRQAVMGLDDRARPSPSWSE